MPGDTNGWNEYSRLVLSEIKRLDESHVKLLEGLAEVRTDIAVMKVKYGLLGGAIGAIPGIIAIVLGVMR